MVQTMRLADLRREPTPGHPDLQGWRFRAAWADEDDATVLAWADDARCILHEAGCSVIAAAATDPSAEGRMAEARDLFAEEREAGTVRRFDFCARCLTERIPNYGWEPTERDLTMLATMRQVLNDVRLLGRKPISRTELTGRMRRYGETPTPTELKRLIEHERQQRGDDDPDLTVHLIK